jgi:putative transposase
MVNYKAKSTDVDIAYVDPAYTSKICSRCGHIGDRGGKSFKCHTCGHVDHADSNAGFNIATRPCIDRSAKERDLVEGTTDTPKVALAPIQLTTEPQVL